MTALTPDEVQVAATYFRFVNVRPIARYSSERLLRILGEAGPVEVAEFASVALAAREGDGDAKALLDAILKEVPAP